MPPLRYFQDTIDSIIFSEEDDGQMCATTAGGLKVCQKMIPAGDAKHTFSIVTGEQEIGGRSFRKRELWVMDQEELGKGPIARFMTGSDLDSLPAAKIHDFDKFGQFIDNMGLSLSESGFFHPEDTSRSWDLRRQDENIFQICSHVVELNDEINTTDSLPLSAD